MWFLLIFPNKYRRRMFRLCFIKCLKFKYQEFCRKNYEMSQCLIICDKHFNQFQKNLNQVFIRYSYFQLQMITYDSVELILEGKYFIHDASCYRDSLQSSLSIFILNMRIIFD